MKRTTTILTCLLILFSGLAWAQVTPLGDVFQVNESSGWKGAYPAVAMDGAGNFLVVYSDSPNILASWFDSSGARVGSERVGISASR